MLTVSPLARPVTSVSCASMVWRLLKSEMFPILTARPASRTRQTSAKTRELEGRLREVPQQPHHRPPEELGDDAAEAGRRGLVGLPDDAVGLVGGRGGRAAGAGRGRRRWAAGVGAAAGVETAWRALNVDELRGAVEGGAGAGQRLLYRLEERHPAGRRRDQVADEAVDVAEEDEGVEVGVRAAVGQLVQARRALGDLLEVVVGAVDDLADGVLLGQQDPGDVVARFEDGGDVGVVRREQRGQAVGERDQRVEEVLVVGLLGVERRAGRR